MKVAEIFRRPIDRPIKEVIKVELADEDAVKDELSEYVATQRIQDALAKVLNQYQETIDAPNTEDTNVWLSGFFGSGKSSFAKVLGYLVENPVVAGKPAQDWFFSNTTAPALQQLLVTKIADRAKTLTVMVDLLSAKNVWNEGESIALPLYRALLEKLGYSTVIFLAELEQKLEKTKQLAPFEERYEAVYGRLWVDDHHDALFKNEASRVLHEIDPATYPSADTFALSPIDIEISHQSFAERALKLLAGRGHVASRIMFILDEAGQYVARDVDRVGDLQGLAEALQVNKSRLWLVATSQQRLEDIVESLEGTHTELARVKDRFDIKIDLLPSDIEEVVSVRVLDKTGDGKDAVRSVFSTSKNKVKSLTKLSGPRAVELAEEHVVRLYPLLPYQVRLFIDVVTARRDSGMTGGSNRTILSLAQQLVVASDFGVGDDDVGVLATVDRAYDALVSIIPPTWSDEVIQVAAKLGADSLEARVLKAISLCSGVGNLTLDVHNLAVLLHPSMASESLEPAVKVAVERLVAEGKIELDAAGYRLQSPEGRTWIEARNAIDAPLNEVHRLRTQLLDPLIGSITVNPGRAFAVELTVGSEKVSSRGEIPLVVVEADAGELDEIVRESRLASSSNRIWWTHELSNGTRQALEELFKSNEMIKRRQGSSRAGAGAELVARERRAADDWRDRALRGLQQDLLGGKVVFQGITEDVPATSDLKGAAQRIVTDRVGAIYSRLSEFAATLKATDPLLVLRDTTLDGVPKSLLDIGLVVIRPTGREIETTKGPLKALLDEVDRLPTDPTGSMLATKLAEPPYGATLEVVQAIVAAAVRQSILDVRHQGARISNPADHRLDAVFKGPAAFRGATFLKHIDVVPAEKRVDLATKLQQLTGTKFAATSDELAQAVRTTFTTDGATASIVKATLAGLGLTVPVAVDTVADAVRDLAGGDADDCVVTALGVWEDLVEGRGIVAQLDGVLTTHLDDLRAARNVVARGTAGLPDDVGAAIAELQGLLESGDLVGHMGRILAITTTATAARVQVLDDLRAELRRRIDDERAELRRRYPPVEPDVMGEALRAIDALLPSEGDEPSPELLEARLGALHDAAGRVAAGLDKVLAREKLEVVRIAEIAPDLIRTPEDLLKVKERLDHRISELLTANKEIRLS
jgi:hypothetical protein